MLFCWIVNTSKAVTDTLSSLRNIISPVVFDYIFQVLLTDNGSEFSNPSAIEFEGKVSRVFYCKSSSPYQKPHVEVNHEFIRRFLPKGSSFDLHSQKNISFMMPNINSYSRDKFNGLSPSKLFVDAFGEDVLHLTGQTIIPPADII